MAWRFHRLADTGVGISNSVVGDLVVTVEIAAEEFVTNYNAVVTLGMPEFDGGVLRDPSFADEEMVVVIAIGRLVPRQRLPDTPTSLSRVAKTGALLSATLSERQKRTEVMQWMQALGLPQYARLPSSSTPRATTSAVHLFACPRNPILPIGE